MPKRRIRDICTKLSIPYFRRDILVVIVEEEKDVPHPINEADIKYAEVAASKFRAEAKIIGGVIRPASIASACCKPLVIANANGRSVSSA